MTDQRANDGQEFSIPDEFIVHDIVRDLESRAWQASVWAIVFLVAIITAIGAGLAYYVFFSAALVTGDVKLIGAAQQELLLSGIKDKQGDVIASFRTLISKPDIFVRLKKLDTRFAGHGGPVQSVAFSPKGDSIVSGGFDGTVRLWDLQGQPIGEAFEGHEGPVFSVAFSPNGERIVSGGDDGTVRLWTTSGQQLVSPLAPNDKNSVTSLLTVKDRIVGASKYDIFLVSVDVPAEAQNLPDIPALLDRDPAGFGERLTRVVEQFKRADASAPGVQLRPELEKLQARWAELAEQKTAAETASTKDDGGATNALQDKVWLSLNLTRIGTIIIVLFLVQVFITMYRYNTRLSAFYRARAHALKLFLSGFDYGEEFDRLANTFTPDTVDFAKSPANPSEQVVKAVEKIAGLRSKGRT